jgi:hypothetical protein
MRWEELARLNHDLYPSDPFVPNPDAWAEYQAKEVEREQERARMYGHQPEEGFIPGHYSVAYAHARQRMGMDPIGAKAWAQVQADGRTHGDDPVPNPDWDRRWVNARLESPIPAQPPVQAGPIPTAASAEQYNPLRLPLQSRMAGKFISPTKVGNPEIVSAAMQPRAVDMSPEEWRGQAPMQAPRDSADQLALFSVRDQTGSGAYNGEPPRGVSIDEPDSLERPAEPPPVEQGRALPNQGNPSADLHDSMAAEAAPRSTTGDDVGVSQSIAQQAVEKGAERVDAMSQTTKGGRRLAGGLAVTGGLGLLGLLGLSAMTDPYEAEVRVQR